MPPELHTGLALLCLLINLYWLWSLLPFIQQPAVVVVAVNSPAPRPLRPRSPDDCPACCTQTCQTGSANAPRPTSVPWSQRKSTRGRKKQLPTQGFACPNPLCAYFGIVDERIRALIAYGKHGTD